MSESQDGIANLQSGQELPLPIQAQNSVYLKRKPPEFYCISLSRLSRNGAQPAFGHGHQKSVSFTKHLRFPNTVHNAGQVAARPIRLLRIEWFGPSALIT